MSFSSEVKKELCRVGFSERSLALAEAYGVLLYANSFSAHEIRVITGSPDFAERLPKLFRRAFSLGFDRAEANRTGSKRSFFITEPEKIAAIFAAFGCERDSTLAHHVNLGILEEESERVAFMRGAFFAGGSVTDPAKNYHLEFATAHRSVSRETFSILLELGFQAKESTRSGNYINYFKQSEVMEDLLTTLGAPVSAMQIMAAKVEKDMRNAINRKINCDTANADKIVSAAQQQLEDIRRIDRGRGLDSLPEKLYETALLRIANPEASLSDLALLSDPPVTKSCLSHRLRKLSELAAALPE